MSLRIKFRTRSVIFKFGVLLLVTFCIILPHFLHTLPFTVYFNRNPEAVISAGLDINANNYKQSKQMQSSWSEENNLRLHNDALSQIDFDIVISIVTVKRVYTSDTPLGYLTQVAVAVDRIFKISQDIRFAVFVCDVYAGPGYHDEAFELERYIPVRRRFVNPSPYHVVMDRFEKEKEDYAYCLQEASSYKSKFVLILEDDAVPVNDFESVLHQTLNSLRYDDSFILKLFYPPRWQGFSSTFRHILELCLFGVFGCTVFYVVNRLLIACTFTSRYFRRYLHSREKTRTTTIYTFVCVYSLLVALVVGRQNWLELRRVIPPYLYTTVPAPDCCSPAILYPRHTAREITKYLNQTTCSPNYPLDKALDDFRERNDIPAYLIEPNLVRHIGMVSTIKGLTRHPEEFLW